MNILVDTSVWVAHFKARNEQLIDLLDAGLVVCHPHVVVEIACGTPPSRKQLITTLKLLEQAPLATATELMHLIDKQRLYGKGCGLVDLSLLASALISGRTLLWTLDQRLAGMAQALGVGYATRLSH